MRTSLATGYRGRFAPSPTGRLHFGSLIAALGSWLDARAHQGIWLVRIEDIDRVRCVEGAADDILRTLETFGLHWDETVIYQGMADSQARYHEALSRLKMAGRLYPCACSRKDIADSSQQGVDGPVYPGTCRGGLPADRPVRSTRIRVGDAAPFFRDRIQGDYRQHLALDVGDFILQRTDGQVSYQLAVVVDDAFQRITHVVRGIDLIASTPRQLFLQQCLGFPHPEYAHLPLAVNQYGLKLSKQNLARPLEPKTAPLVLAEALQFLGHPPPVELAGAGCRSLLEWARQRWEISRVPRQHHIVAETADTVPPER